MANGQINLGASALYKVKHISHWRMKHLQKFPTFPHLHYCTFSPNPSLVTSGGHGDLQAHLLPLCSVLATLSHRFKTLAKFRHSSPTAVCLRQNKAQQSLHWHQKQQILWPLATSLVSPPPAFPPSSRHTGFVPFEIYKPCSYFKTVALLLHNTHLLLPVFMQAFI